MGLRLNSAARSSASRVSFTHSRNIMVRLFFASPFSGAFALLAPEGGSGRGAQGRVAKRMIKDIIIHIWGEAERELSAIPDALSRSRGALSPAGP